VAQRRNVKLGILERLRHKQEVDTYLETQEKTREQFRHTYALGITRWCFTCKHFILRLERPRNRVCRCPPDQLHFKTLANGTDECLGWELDPNYVTSQKKR
jgi:hypothetical protein